MSRLFQNRSLQVKMVKHDAAGGVAPVAPSTDQVETLIVSLSVCIGALILVYMGGDTMRQVMIHAATKTIR